MDVMNTLVFNRSLKELKLRNISPTSVERVSLRLDDCFSGDTTPDAVKFKVKGGSKSVGQPDLMGASSSSAHENGVVVPEVVSKDDDTGKVDSSSKEDNINDAKKTYPMEPVAESEHYQVVEENIDVDATIASAVKAVENLIGSSTTVSASAETSEKNDLEMVVFQETPILRPQKRDRKKGAHIDIIFYYLRKKIKYSAEPKIKVTTTDCLFCSSITSLYDKFVEKNNDISMLSLSHNVAQYIRGGKILYATPWHLVDHVVMPINVKLQDHWIYGRLNIAEPRIYLYNSLRSGRYMTAAKEACKPFSVILPYYFSMLDIRGLRNESKFSTMEPFPIVAVDGLPEQVTTDCGVFVASFAEYFIDGKPIPSFDFDVEIHRDCFAVSFYHYGMKKQLENIESESEAPPSIPKK
ncbi:hypothetical protein G4B88_023221 [Cannabis sativa]|uniref:Ubiquitin-like protease family profile domain-containing protein n=1 Tax=Cannabis sativa TaxID=3483 RepID=A0A7J6DVZ0_CANSA|nr:hypothetical protein G4B88_023221 [Cannabis sativa]